MGCDHLTDKDYTAGVRKVLIITLILNSAVAIAKIIYGYLTNSIAMTSDGFHSLFDGVSNVIGLLGIWIASHPPDEEHPYGHRKYETLFTIVIALMIFATCFQILRKVYLSFFDDHRAIVTATSFLVMFITIGINVFVMLYESKKGRQFGSDFLLADAMHTKSDIFTSVSVIAGLLFTKLGFHYADAIVGLVITVFIARIGLAILKNASNILVDTVCIDKAAVRAAVNSIDGVKGCHDIRSRGTASSVYLDLHVLVENKMTIEQAHGITETIEEDLKKTFPMVVDVVVHVEPEKMERREGQDSG
jgi:cation diffusion facilitator family transporter